MADRHGTALPLLIFISMFQPSLSDTLTCTSSVSTINLNPSTDPYKTYKYPATGLYPRTTTCKWLFQATDASSRITFEVTSIYVDCGDTLKFHDGTSSSASAIGSSVCCSSSSSCGSSKPPATTTGNSLFLQLDSDGTDNSYETGFTVTVVVGKDESNCSASGTFNVNLASTLTLTSPQFPDKYPISRNCTYTYTYSNGNVQFEFIYMKVELYSGTCFDSVEIFNGSSTSSPLIAKVCGDTVPAQNIFTSSGTSLTIKFSSDGQETKTGFLARVTPVDQTAVSSSVTTGSSSSAYITTTINNAGTTGTNEPSTVNDSSTTTETSTQQQYETSGNVEKETTTQIQGEMTTSLPTESTTKVINLQSTTIKEKTTEGVTSRTTTVADTTKTEVTSQPTLTVGDTTKADVTSRPISVRDNNSPFIADSTDSNGGVIAAGVTVALVVIALFVAGGVILFKKKKKRSIDIYD
ncbi:neuropilin-1-like isoform X13 [Saccostrea echinata]|uniref:neuropilin-1-like isoform X13 n=1 Tax=Saccostrea echinata TaxID=191078 RepID=UPI002A8073FE|nr:neuropilin-1-like isoform X13 [Saccostrea echinata]